MLLIEQSRHEMALGELEQLLIQFPEMAEAHSFRGLCLAELNRFAEAVESVQNAIHLAPDMPHAYFTASIVFDKREDLKQAEKHARTAIEIAPYQDHYFAQLANILLQNKKWQAALDTANEGLEIDPENIDCNNIRAIALMKLGRKADAGDSIQASIQKNPDNAMSHANMGWNHLERRQPHDALPCFREALRLEPGMEWARVGIIEAMKSRFFIYRWLLAFFLWTSKLSGKMLIGLILGGYFGSQFLMRWMDRQPELTIYLMPIVIAYTAFAIMTWIGSPLFNLTLWFNSFGRMALSKEEKRVSLAICVLVAISLFFVGTWFFSRELVHLIAALGIALTMPTVSTVYQSDQGWPRAVHWLYLLLLLSLALIVVTAVSGLFLLDKGRLYEGVESIAFVSSFPLILSGFLSQFAVPFLILIRPRRDSRSGRLVWLIGGPILAFGLMVVVGLSGLVFLAGLTRESEVDTIPLRLKLTMLKPSVSESAKQLNAYSKPIENLNFQVVGDYYMESSSPARIRYLLDAENHCLVEVTEILPAKKFMRAFSVLDQNGRLFSVTDHPDDSMMPVPSDWVRENVSPTTSAEEMLLRLNKMTAGIDRREIVRDSIVETAGEIYAKMVDQLCASGGLKPEKIQKILADQKMPISDAHAALLCRNWNEKLAEAVDQFLLDELIEERPELETQRDKLHCVHRLKGIFGAARIMDPDVSKISDRIRNLTRAVDSDKASDYPDAIADIFDTTRFEKIDRRESPLTADIYLRKKTETPSRD